MAESGAGKTWVFTIFNPLTEDIKWVMDLEVLRITVSKEVGEEGTEHLQGAVTFTRKYTFKQVKKLHPKAHWELAKATQDFNYCKKLGSEVLRNEDHRCSGKRTDIENTRDELEAGADFSQIMKKAKTLGSVTFAKHWFNTFEEHLPKGTKVEVYWYYGNTGTGKTKRVLDQCSPFIPLSFKWWEGYQGQDAVLLDDLRPGWCSPEQLLRLLDPYRYQYRVEVKGGSRPLIATKIYVTTPWHPEDFWQDLKEDPKQLMRRIHEMIFFKENGDLVLKKG